MKNIELNEDTQDLGDHVYFFFNKGEREYKNPIYKALCGQKEIKFTERAVLYLMGNTNMDKNVKLLYPPQMFHFDGDYHKIRVIENINEIYDLTCPLCNACKSIYG